MGWVGVGAFVRQHGLSLSLSWEHHLSYGLLAAVGGMSFTFFLYLLSLLFSYLLTFVLTFVICRIGPCIMGCARISPWWIGEITTPPRTTWIRLLMIRLAILSLSSFASSSSLAFEMTHVSFV